MYDYILHTKPKLPRVKLIVPFPNYLTYPRDYSLFKELFFKPESSSFLQVQFNEFYKRGMVKLLLILNGGYLVDITQ